LAAGYEIDLWNRLHDKEQASELRLQAGEKEAQTLLLSLTAQLTENYFQALEKRGQVALIEEQIERNQQLLESAADRYRAGLATAEELYQARNNLAAQQARLPQLQTALNLSEQEIALLLGRKTGAELTTRPSLPQLSSLVDVGLPASLLQNRPDIAAAFLQLQAADHELAAALADRLPAINMTASLGHSAAKLASGDIEGSFWNLAASLTQPLFDGGRRQAEVERQHAIRNEQLAKVQQTLLKAVQEVETALVADQNNARRSNQLMQQRRSSDRSLVLSRDNYRSGLTSSSALLAAEIQHLTLLSQQLSSHREWLNSRITLARALGGQWMSTELSKLQQALTKAEDKPL
jgi:NodT family efflux transporter outer membrane factor (OMF) lipoprotein